MLLGVGVDERLRRALRERVEDYLAGVERLLDHDDPPVPWEVIRARVAPLLRGWRALLEAHAPGLVGRCRYCDRPRLVRRGPCAVWRTAHAQLIAGVPPVGTG